MAIKEVIHELNRIQSEGLVVDYAVGGAVAALAYIEASSTEDVDVFVILRPGASDLAPLGEIWANLQAHGAVPEGERLVIGEWPVQFLPPGSPLDEDAIRNAQPWDFGGVSGRIMRPEYVAAIALALGRAKDKVRVEEFVRRGRLDMAEFTKVLTKHGLLQQWNIFTHKYLDA